MRKAFFIFVLAFMVLSSLQGCNGDKTASRIKGESIDMEHASLLTMEEINEESTIVTIKNPWDTTKVFARYALVERGNNHIPDLPSDVKVIEIPVQRAVVYSGLHTSLLHELGKLSVVKGMCDIDYVNDSATLRALQKGRIIDCGRNSSPVMEKIVSLRPEIILLSPYENSDDESRYKALNVKLVEAADYMEPTPLGRAEWMRFYGRLFGVGAKADSLFKQIEGEYLSLREKAANAKVHPEVLFDRSYSGKWYVPTSGSVTGRLIEDAGGRNPFAYYDNGGSAALSAEEVFHKGKNADIWLIRHSETTISMSSIANDSPVYSRFEAYKNGNVYVANTLTTRLFEDGAFHPEKTLREMVRILHPEIDSSPLQYFTKAK